MDASAPLGPFRIDSFGDEGVTAFLNDTLAMHDGAGEHWVVTLFILAQTS